ncbi:MAG: hypothetical protein NTY68_02595 [Candidatus Micrarchaeota archaeon]|nr:hypothetical protein [Candidatus Micrarchaeota archaeon]
MVVIQKPLQVAMKEKGITEPKAVERVLQNFRKYKDKVDDLYNRANEWVHDGMEDSKKQKALQKEYFELRSMLHKAKDADIFYDALAWRMGVLSSYVFTKGKVHLSVGLAANPALEMHLGLSGMNKMMAENLDKAIYKLREKAKSLIAMASSAIPLDRISKEGSRKMAEFASYMSNKMDKKHVYKVINGIEVVLYASEFEFLKDYYMHFDGVSKSDATALAKETCKYGYEKMSGVYHEDENKIYINLERLKKDFGKDYIAQAWVTLAHELAHGLGGFRGTYRDMDSEVFNDALCEHIADDFVRNKLDMNFASNPYTISMNSVCWKLFGLIGEEKVFEAYVSRNLSKIEKELDEAITLDSELAENIQTVKEYIRGSECVHFRCFAALMTEELENTEISSDMARAYARMIAQRKLSISKDSGKVGDQRMFFLPSLSDDETAIRAGFISTMKRMRSPESMLIPVYPDPAFISSLSARIATEYKLNGGDLADSDSFTDYFVGECDAYFNSKMQRAPLSEMFMEHTSLDKNELHSGMPLFDIALLHIFLSKDGVLPHSVREIDSQIRRFIRKADYSRFGPFTDALMEESYRKTMSLARIKVKESSSIDSMMTFSDIKSNLVSRYGLNQAMADQLIDLVGEYARLIGVSDTELYYPEYSEYSEVAPWELLGLVRAAIHNINTMLNVQPVESDGLIFHGRIQLAIRGQMLIHYFNMAVEENRIHQNVKTATFCSASTQLYGPVGFTGVLEL